MREIKLTQGQVALVDDEDFDLLNQYKWFARRTETTYYAHNRALGDMHRFLLNTSKDIEVDHKDLNGLNNQRLNIRSCTKSQNNANRKCKNPIGFKGVYRCHYKHKEQWQARITVNKKRIDLGFFNSIEKAANAYNQAAINYFGDFARLNHIEISELIKIKIIDKEAKYPTKAYIGDAAYDVFNNSPTITMGFGERFMFRLGFSIEIPYGHVALIQEKSGMAINDGIMTIGNVIDSNYRGECHAILCSLNQKPITISHGQKIAQMMIMPCYTGIYYQVIDNDEELSSSNRGEKGFGSTGL